MALLAIDVIRQQLDEQFLPLEPMLTGFRLIDRKISIDDVTACERELGVRFPHAFRELLHRFDFGCLTIGPIAFCNTGDYFGWLRTTNSPGPNQEYYWWGEGERPKQMLMIAGGDPYTIILDTISGRVFAFRDGESWRENSVGVADNFDSFLRGIGTVVLGRSPDRHNEALATAVATCSGVDSDKGFWLKMAK